MTSTTKRATDRASDPVGSALPARRSGDGLHINADTGLCTDYLNHFNEAIMLLEMLPAVPDSIEDFLAWRPCSYREHFAASGFKNREAVIAAYQGADPAVRNRLDALADSMNRMLLTTREAMKTTNTAVATDALAQHALARVKPLVMRAGLLINGSDAADAGKAEANAAQSAVDALFKN